MFSKRLFWKISTFGVQVKRRSWPDPYIKPFWRDFRWRVFLLASFPYANFPLTRLPLTSLPRPGECRLLRGPTHSHRTRRELSCCNTISEEDAAARSPGPPVRSSVRRLQLRPTRPSASRMATLTSVAAAAARPDGANYGILQTCSSSRNQPSRARAGPGSVGGTDSRDSKYDGLSNNRHRTVPYVRRTPAWRGRTSVCRPDAGTHRTVLRHVRLFRCCRPVFYRNINLSVVVECNLPEGRWSRRSVRRSVGRSGGRSVDRSVEIAYNLATKQHTTWRLNSIQFDY